MSGMSLNRAPMGSSINTTGFGNFGVQPSIPPMMQQAPFQSLNRGLSAQTTSTGLPLPPPPLPSQQQTSGGLPPLPPHSDMMFNNNRSNHLPSLHNNLPIPPQDNLIMSSRMNNTNNFNGNKRGNNNLGKCVFAYFF